MKPVLVDDRDGLERRIAVRRGCALAAPAAALAALFVALLGAAPAQAWTSSIPLVRDARSVQAAPGLALADKQRARQRHRAIARHHAVSGKRGHRAKPKRGVAPPPGGAAVGAPAGSPSPAAAAPVSAGADPSAAPAADGRGLTQGGAGAPPVQHGVEPDPPVSEGPKGPPAGEPPAEEPEQPPVEEPETEEPGTPPAEEPEPPVEEPEPPSSEEPEPPVEEPEPPVTEEPEPPAGPDLLFAGRTIRDFAMVQAAKGAITEVPDPLGSGQTVFKLTVKDSDVAPVTPTENPRAQLVSPDLVEAGDEFWMKTKFLIPQDFPTVTGWMSMLSLYGAPFNGSSPWQIELIGDHLQWMRNRTYGFDVPWQAPLVKGAWVTVLTHERFATDGFIEMWINGQQVKFFDRETRLEMKTMDSSNNTGPNSIRMSQYREAGMFETGTTYFGPVLFGATRAAVEA